jgi:hypothetical protein
MVPRTIARISFLLRSAPIIYPSGPLATIIPNRKIGNNTEPGAAPLTVPTVAAIVNPIADPKRPEINPTLGPRNIEATKIAAGAKVIADNGGGKGNDVTVNTATSADITADCVILVTRLRLEKEV